MFNIPLRPSLQEFQIALVGVECQPVALTADSWNLLVRITDVFKVESPMLVGLVSQMLWFTGDGVDLTPCCADFLNDSCFYIAP